MRSNLCHNLTCLTQLDSAYQADKVEVDTVPLVAWREQILAHLHPLSCTAQLQNKISAS